MTEDEYVFQFQRFDLRIDDVISLMGSAQLLVADGPPLPGHSLPSTVETPADAVDAHVAIWGLSRIGEIPGTTLASGSSRTAMYDLSESELDDSMEDPFLWGVNDDEDED